MLGTLLQMPQLMREMPLEGQQRMPVKQSQMQLLMRHHTSKLVLQMQRSGLRVLLTMSLLGLRTWATPSEIPSWICSERPMGIEWSVCLASPCQEDCAGGPSLAGHTFLPHMQEAMGDDEP
mmetsp:Transcript_62947/g.117037  ORF Transcript_62947/g.117037 Transcript_62947/m.117037 type:complete len:121 (-) Transcript_62947:50-412(-)